MLAVQVKSHDKQLRQIESAMSDTNGHPAMLRAISGCIAEGHASQAASSSSGTPPCSRDFSPIPSSQASLASTPPFSPWMDPFECVDAAAQRASAWRFPALVPTTGSEAEPSSLSARVAHPPRIDIPPPRVVNLNRAACPPHQDTAAICAVFEAHEDVSCAGEDVFSEQDMVSTLNPDL
jgi:hypothetical protein